MNVRPRRRKRITADELLDRLEQDPDHSARQQAWERERQEARAEYDRAAAPVLADLAQAGFLAHTVGDLRYQGRKYREAVPVLLRWLPDIDDIRVKEDIVRTLSVPWAKPAAAPALIEEYRRAHDPVGTGLKWAIGNGLSIVADDSVFDEVVDLVRDRQHRRAREMVAVALGNMRDPRAVDVLIGLLDDEEVAGHALMALGKLKAQRARPHIEPFLRHSKAWVRREAKRALAKIAKAEEDRGPPHK
jgi:HEAT repeat protein